ncbi:MAG: glycoside hydrolase family 3 C-terminal domain-containing protein [Lachnospiraceae bacterium]|nr:glycoside hydrolase family 3 C-terminal domain-containing protein [Lachnospiraceae bacterium]
MERAKIREIVSKMTLEEKARMCSGSDFWHTEEIERVGIPASMVSDGPHGLRKQDMEGDHLGVNDSIVAVCFPAGCATAASFDTELVGKMGQALGESAQAEDLSVVLGPAVNIKRSPLCGRNFEYYSEDPYLAGKIAAAYINGVQSKNVGTSIKHYLGNNQETRRLTVDAKIDERTLREIYLPAFEEAVKEAKPWTVMASYNKINGEHTSESRKFLTDILRDEWGFDGYVMSDWGAVCNRVEGIRAGLDLEMPSSKGVRDKQIVEAVQKGELDEALVDLAVENILNIVFRYKESKDASAVFDRKAQHEFSGEIAKQCIVLLKNDGILPIAFEEKQAGKVAFIGKYAKTPRFQGGGSSHITCFDVTGAIQAAEDMGFKDKIVYAQGYDDKEDKTDEALLAEAVETAKAADVAVIFAGLPDAFESEAYDRQHMRMPDCQNRLIEEVAKVQPNVIVVLHNGSPVEMPWIDKVKGIVESYLGGENIGLAQMEVLSGRFNPCGKLPETFPLKLADNPSFLNFPGEGNVVEYREGIFVGYRYYDTKEMEVLFPFGHGLSYTEFAYANLKVSKDSLSDTDTLTVSVDVTNSGKVAGSEIVQLYVADPVSDVIRPVKELKGFAKVTLEPGETKTATFTLDKRAFAYYETKINDWYAESGEYEILVGASSRDIRCRAKVKLTASKKLPVFYTIDSTFCDVMKDEHAKSLMGPIIEAGRMEEVNTTQGEGLGSAAEEMNEAMLAFAPIRNCLSFGNGSMDEAKLQAIVDKMNQR